MDRDAAQLEVARSAVSAHKARLTHSVDEAVWKENRAGEKAETAAWLAKNKATSAAQKYTDQMHEYAQRVKQLDAMEREPVGGTAPPPATSGQVVIYPA